MLPRGATLALALFSAFPLILAGVQEENNVFPPRTRGERLEANLKLRDQEHKDKYSNRTGKIFSLFSIVNFNNAGCQSTSSLTNGQASFRNGTCYSSNECSSRGGSANGGCAAGFGVCCVFIANSATTITENCTYLQNPSFPSTDTASTAALTYTVARCSNDICTLRLDFETFNVRGTAGTADTTDGQCTDTFTVTVNTGQIIPVICGVNSGYHMYVDIGSVSGNTASLAFAFSDTTTARNWDIKVTQQECSNPSRPPDTCLQYLTGLTGRIESFNFASNGDNHLASQNYNVCVRPEAGFCCIQYQVCPDQTGANNPGFSLDATNGPMVDDSCTSTDYITIDSSSDVCVSSTSTSSTTLTSRYCGMFLNNIGAPATANNVVCDCTQPFSVGIFTNADTDMGANAANTIASLGVCLEYTQVPC